MTTRAGTLPLAFLAAFGLLTTDTSSAVAQVVDDTVTRAAFVAADGNGDGVVDEAEFAADAIKAFGDLDANDDGVLVPDELAGASTAAFSAVDVDKDGRLTLLEVQQRRLADFTAMDSSGDGVLSMDEALAFKPAR